MLYVNLQPPLLQPFVIVSGGWGWGAGVANRSFVVFSVSALVLIFNTKKSYFQLQLKAVAMINVSFLSLSRISTGIQTKLHSKKKKN